MDNLEKLVISFDDEEDGTGELFVEATSNGFAGNSSAWFSKSRLIWFANALAAYPIPSNNHPEIAGGIWKNDAEELDEEHLFIKVYPIDGIGNLGLQIRLATPHWSGQRPESHHVVKLEITTSYNALEVFSKELIALIKGRVEKAIL